MLINKSLLSGSKLIHSSASSHLDAEVLLAKILKISRGELIANSDKLISIFHSLLYFWLILKRKLGYPVAYLTNRKEFYGREFIVTKHTLIPRPDTEILIAEALKIIQNNNINDVVDVGTGSGCIAVTLALEAPQLKVYATDISRLALHAAQKNAKLYSLDSKINFLWGDTLNPVLNILSPQTLIIANLPYLLPHEYKGEITFEPRNALVSGQDGLKHYRKLLNQLAQLPPEKRPGFLIIEIHPATLNNLKDIISQTFPQNKVIITADLSGRPRVLTLRLF